MISPLPEILGIGMKILVHKFGWYTKSTKHFDTKMPKIGVSTKDGANHDE